MNSIPRQTVPDFQETRPRNYILSASASAVSTPPAMPHPVGPQLLLLALPAQDQKTAGEPKGPAHVAGCPERLRGQLRTGK